MASNDEDMLTNLFWPEQPEDNEPWQPGDACASCGSRETGYDVTDGATCNGCGRTDADA